MSEDYDYDDDFYKCARCQQKACRAGTCEACGYTEASDDETTIDYAMNAFWAAVAEKHPEISSGDLPPDATITFEKACEEVISTWLLYNGDE